MAKALKIALNVILGEETATAAEIANALRAQADALDGAGKAAPAKSTKKQKPAKEDDDEGTDDTDSDTETDEDDSDGEMADSDDADGEESEAEESEADENDAEEEAEKGPSKTEVLKTLKLVAAKKKKSVAVSVMKKATGKDSIHDVKAKDYAKLHKALKAALKA